MKCVVNRATIRDCGAFWRVVRLSVGLVCLVAVVLTTPVLATVATWNGADANWTAADNWNLSPAFQGDEKYYPQNDNPYGARYEAFIMDGRVTLTLSPIIDAFHLSGGTLAGSEHTVTMGEFYWSGGVLAGGVQADGGVHIGPADAYIDGGRLTQSKDAWGGMTAYALTLKNGGTFKNEGMWDVSGSGSWIQQQEGARGTFENTGVLNVGMTSNSNEFNFYRIDFLNSGTVNVWRGRLMLQSAGGGTPLGGEFALAAGTEMNFVGDYTLDSSCKLTGLGTVRIYHENSSTITFNNPTISAKLALHGGTIKGTLNPTGCFYWNSGTVAANLTANGGMEIASTGGQYLDGATVQLPQGQEAKVAGSINFKNGTTFNNNGRVVVTAESVFSTTDGTRSTFNNAGVMDINLPSSDDDFTISLMAFDHSGTVNVNRGRFLLSYSASSVPMTGAFNIASGATLKFAGINTNYVLGPACTIAGDGVMNFTDSNTTLTLDNSTITANPVFDGGTVRGTFSTSKRFVFNTGILAANLTANGGVYFGSGSCRIDGVTVTLPAGQQTTLSGSGALEMRNGATMNNAGTFTANGGIMGIGEGAFPTFNNQGTFEVSVINATEFQVLHYFKFHNTGLIDIRNGKLVMGGTFTQSAGTLLLNGGSLVVSPPLSIGGGSLAGSGTVSGSVVLGGTLSPGHSAGTINITGSLTLDAGAHIAFDLGDSSDLITVGGNLLKGTGGNYLFDFAAEPNTRLGLYRLIDFNGTTTFSAGDFIYTGGLEGNFVLDGHSLSFNVTVIPEPAGLAVLGLTALGLMRRRAA